MKFRTGDTVRHVPSGELWTVAWADHRDVMWCGWPEGYAKISDCELVEACTDEEHWKLVREWASNNRDDGRARCNWAYLESHLEQQCLSIMYT